MPNFAESVTGNNQLLNQDSILARVSAQVERPCSENCSDEKSLKPKSRPILMHVRSIRGILEGRKTQTRRLAGLSDVNVNPAAWEHVGLGPLGYMAKPSAKGKYGATFTSRLGGIEPGSIHVCPTICPYGKPGDWLWVRETWLEFYASSRGDIHEAGVRYADKAERIIRIDHQRYGGSTGRSGELRWRPSIHMPRWASRLALEVTDIRVERVQDISHADAIAEGCSALREWDLGNEYKESPRAQFRGLWDDTNGKGAWERNDWLWVVSFKRCDGSL